MTRVGPIKVNRGDLVVHIDAASAGCVVVQQGRTRRHSSIKNGLAVLCRFSGTVRVSSFDVYSVVLAGQDLTSWSFGETRRHGTRFRLV
jgi:hypothetical protein